MATLILEQLARSVADEVHVAQLDLSLEAGTFHVLLGPTRAGKTSLLRLIAGLDRPDHGRVYLEGAPDPELRGQVAMVYQDFVNYPTLRVFQNIAAPLRARRVAAPEIERRVHGAAERVGLEGLLERLPSELSGGQQQRLAIARALVQDARVVLLDEPLANLDYRLREDLREEVRALFTGSDTVVVYATTDPAEALWFAGSVVVLDEGRVLQHGPGRELYDRPANERVARIMSDPPINLWDARLEAGRLHLTPEVALPVPAHLARLASGPCKLGVRPHHLCVTPGPQALPISMRVELAEVDGSSTRLHGTAGALAVLAEEAGVRTHRLGEQLEVFLDPRRMLAFDCEGRLHAAPDATDGQD